MNKIYRIIHLDDNPLILESMKTLFKDEGSIEYHGADTVEEAYALLDDALPDLLIVDLMLDQTNDATQGRDFLKEVHAKYPSLKKMVLSARPDESLQRDLREYIVEYDTKTFRPEQYVDKIMKILRGEYPDKEN